MRETEDDANKMKDFYIHWLEEFLLFKCPYYPQPSTDSLQALPKFQWQFSKK